VIYRKAGPDDAAQLAEFGARSFVDSYAHVMDRAELEAYVCAHYTPERVEEEISDPAGASFLALDPDIVGFAQVRAGNRPECEMASAAPAELRRIYVERSRHGGGVATKLLGMVQAEARVRGCDVLWLAVWEINDRAISFYRKNGFSMAGRQGFPIGNEVQTDHVMAKSLADELH
jgi:ribosomal protein S18 acetylase RimI-like enzyme